MSTYNGERFLKEQLDSILFQKGVDVQLFIRDDASIDRTPFILKEYSNRFKNIHIYLSNENLGPCSSFFSLMKLENLPGCYYALADQDDIWHKDKLISAMNMLKEQDDNPTLYYSNLCIVDENGNYCRKSHTFPQIDRNRFSFLSECLATGCTIVYNQKLADIIIKTKPDNYSLHDIWLYCVAKLFGVVVYDFEPHIDYRQHGNNAEGTMRKRLCFDSIRREFDRVFKANNKKSSDALILLHDFGSILSDDELDVLNQIIHYKDSVFQTIKLLCNKNLYPTNVYRRFKHLLRIIFRTF